MTEFNILVLSDLHAHDQDINGSETSSSYSSHPRFQNERSNPILGCAELFRNTQIPVHWIICPGDLGDKNNESCKQFAWRELNWLRRKLNASHLIASVGNHDVDSRRLNSETPPDFGLKSLSPKFPIVGPSVRNLADQYWKDGFIVKTFKDLDVTICVLNTCAFHGTGGEEFEFSRGRIPETVLESLSLKTKNTETSINLLLMHHHIHRHPWLPTDESHISNGLQLIEILKESENRWFAIHGHRHLPQLWYSGTSPNSPVILSSGSPSATPYKVRGLTPRNQMHLVSFNKDNSNMDVGGLCGRVQSWSWGQGTGWVQGSPRGDGLPSVCGFGHSGGTDMLAELAESFLESSKRSTVDWRLVSKQIPRIEFLTPEDFAGFEEFLERRSMQILYDRYRNPVALQSLE